MGPNSWEGAEDKHLLKWSFDKGWSTIAPIMIILGQDHNLCLYQVLYTDVIVFYKWVKDIERDGLVWGDSNYFVCL